MWNDTKFGMTRVRVATPYTTGSLPWKSQSLRRNPQTSLAKTTTGQAPGEIASISLRRNIPGRDVEEEKTCLTRTTAPKNPMPLMPKRKCARLSNVASRKSKLRTRQDDTLNSLEKTAGDLREDDVACARDEAGEIPEAAQAAEVIASAAAQSAQAEPGAKSIVDESVTQALGGGSRIRRGFLGHAPGTPPLALRTI